MVLDPENLKHYPVYDVLRAGAKGLVGIDQRWVHALVDEPEKTLPDIARFAADDHSEDVVPVDQDLINIFQHLKSPAGLPFLMDLIRHDPSDIPDEVVEAVVAIGAPAVEPLLELCGELESSESSAVAFLLAGLNVKDDRIRDLLLKQLDVDQEDALFNLEVYADSSVIPLLEERLAKTEDEDARLDLEDTIEDLRETKAPTFTDNFNIWEYYPEEAPPEYEALSEEERLEMLTDGPPKLRAGAAASFFGDELSDAVKGKLLEKARQDPDTEVRASCWESFFDQTDEPELRKAMMVRLEESDTPPVERAGLALGLARHTDQPAVRNAILELAKQPETRERAVEAMWRSFDAAFGPEASRYLEDADLEVRRNAIWCIGYLQVTDSAPDLEKFFEDEELRPDALHNYALVMPGATTRKRTPEMFKKLSDIAGGFTEGETDAVKAGFDVRLVRAGLKPFYDSEGGEEEVPEPAKSTKVGRNEPCPCGSGKKYKKCHGAEA
jgi:HEAT repeat protein